MERFGRLDIVVNNAATNPQYGPLAEADMGAVQKVLAVNLEGPLRYVQAAWRHWMKEHGGSIVNIASMGGLRIEPMLGAYNVSKAALLHMTAQLAREMAPQVRVNAVAPGLIKTEMSRVLWEQPAIVGRQPLGFVADPADIGTAVLYLVSDAARYVTGETIFVDGGVSTT
jgi:3-oxoacyl-[acyl-carrier protein] reductase